MQHQVNLHSRCQIIKTQLVTLWTRKEGILNVATSLDLSDHISERSRVEKAAASTITRKPDKGWKLVSVGMMFAVTCQERHTEVLLASD